MRIVAKVIDWIFFMILSLCLITFFTAVCMKFFGGGFVNTFHEVIVSIEATTDSNQIYELIMADKNVIFICLLIGNVLMLLTSLFYFGLIGKRVNGSLGKNLCKFKVLSTDKKVKVNATRLLMREPLVYLQVLTVICTITSFFIYSMSLVTIFGIVIAVYYLRKNEFWNVRNNLEVVR